MHALTLLLARLTCTHPHTLAHTRARTHTLTHTRLHTHTLANPCPHTHACTHTLAHTHTHLSMHTLSFSFSRKHCIKSLDATFLTFVIQKTFLNLKAKKSQTYFTHVFRHTHEAHTFFSFSLTGYLNGKQVVRSMHFYPR